MADLFGDLDLFSEFEKDRVAQGSFIHYDEENLKSRIVFEDYAEEQESGSEDELNGADNNGESSVGKSESSKNQKDDFKSSSSNGAGEVSSEELSTEDAEIAARINEQLYADAAEEAKNSNINVPQLVYERNKYRLYAKMLDSTRCVPDDDSPAVQLIFNNNSFARKYRQQIEQFIKGLLWEELNSGKNETVPEVIVKPGVPTCIDINRKLPPEKRQENMRQKHAIIGNSQFHKQFLVDFLGWPFAVSEPVRCNINWEIPQYSQVYNEVYADPSNKPKKASHKRPKPTCWNCGEESHAMAECKQARNQAKISANRKEFMAQQQQSQGNSEPKFTGPSRYHLDPELSSDFSKFKPGVVSETLREALGLSPEQLPQHIYKMRLYGYPPGWLAEARQIQSGVSIFDKNGRVTLITGECLEDGELEDGEVKVKAAEYDVNKIIEFPGFTVPVPDGFIDEHSLFKMPPIQQHQLKKTLMLQSTQTPSRKRKRARDQDDEEETKKIKADNPVLDDGEINAIATEDGEASDKQSGGETNLDDEPTGEGTERAAAHSSMKPPATSSVASLPRSSSTVSISRDYGTPVIEREKPGLPDASLFGQGIEEHIPYENLPNSIGTFDKMRELIMAIRRKNN